MQQGGTRFLLYPQPPFLEGFGEPEVVEVSSPPGSIAPGPSDERMYTVFPHDKRVTYGDFIDRAGHKFAPPWRGTSFPPAMPTRGGHFDRIPVGTPQFEMAHLFGSVRFVLDIWEGYFDQPITWHFGDFHERMELLIMPRFPNATMGYGFMEIGGYHMDNGDYRPFSLNFDVLGHEVGHSIIYPIVGLPKPGLVHNDYYGFHESAADMVGLLSSLHFDSVLDGVLRQTSGNLYANNKFNRMGELSENDQIRMAANTRTLWEFTEGWESEHDLGLPLTAAMFDTIVDLFHESLKARGVMSPEMEMMSDALEYHPEYGPRLQDAFNETYARHPEEMREALIEARDFAGTYLAVTFSKLTPRLTYRDVAEALLEAEAEVSGGRYQEIFRHNLARRGIGIVDVGPRLSDPEDGHNAAPSHDDHCYPCSRFGRHRKKGVGETETA